MADDGGDAVGTIAGAIRRYFETNPAAADSVDGIVRWWLPVPLNEEPRPLVELALDRLVAEGMAQCIVLEGGRVVYRRARWSE